jgi:hypothetical protein
VTFLFSILYFFFLMLYFVISEGLIGRILISRRSFLASSMAAFLVGLFTLVEDPVVIFASLVSLGVCKIIPGHVRRPLYFDDHCFVLILSRLISYTWGVFYM